MPMETQQSPGRRRVLAACLMLGSLALAVSATAQNCPVNLAFTLDRPDFGRVLDQYVTSASVRGNLYTMVQIGTETFIVVSSVESMLDGLPSTAPTVSIRDSMLILSSAPPTGFDIIEEGIEYIPGQPFGEDWAVITLGSGGLGAIEAELSTLGAASILIEELPGIAWDAKALPVRNPAEDRGVRAQVLVAAGTGGLQALDLDTQARNLTRIGSITVPGDVRAVEGVTTPTDTLALVTNGQGVRVYRLDAARPPQVDFPSAAVRDPTTESMFLFTGDRYSTPELPVWRLDLATTTWENALNILGPGPASRDRHRAIYDPIRHSIVIYGGSRGDPFDMTPFLNPWRLDLEEMSWAELVPSTAIPDSLTRLAASVVFDPDRDRMVVFGGYRDDFGAPPGTDQTWGFDFATNSWSILVDPSDPHPSARGGAGGVFVPGNATRPDRMFIFGGEDPPSGVEFHDLWMLDLESDPVRWTRPLVEGVPPQLVPPYGLANHTMVYDDSRDRIVMFGDTLGPTSPNAEAIYYLNLNASAPDTGSVIGDWETFNPPFIELPPRIDMSAIVDPGRDGVLVFGGQDSSGFKSDLQIFDFEDERWSEVLPSVLEFVDSLNVPGSGEDLAVSGDSIFVAGGLSGVSVVKLGRISDPSDTTFQVIDSLGGPGYAHGVEVLGKYLYVSARSGGLQVWNTSTLSEAAIYPQLDEVEDTFVVGWGVRPGIPVDSAMVFVGDEAVWTVLTHEDVDQIPPVLAVAPVEKAGLPGRFGVYAVASECLDADTLFTVDGLDYRFEFAWMDLGSVLHPDSTSFRPLDMDVIDPLARLYGSATTLNIGPVLDSLANAVDGLVADSLRLVFAWEAKDASPQINVGSGMEEIAVGTVLGDIGASLHAVNPAIQLDVLPGAFAGREHFYLIEASSAMTRVPGGRAMLDPLRGTPDPASSGLVAAGAWCHVGWTGETARIPFRLHLPVTSAKNAAVYRLNDGAWERIGGDTSNGEIVALISRGGLYRVFEGPAAGPVAARSMLDQNVPNPFNPVTVIQYRLPEPAQVTLGVYDVGGRLVRMLEQGFRDAGEASVVWRGDDDAGNEVASGVYFYRLQVSGGREESRKMVLMR